MTVDVDWTAVIGCSPEAFSDRLHAGRPRWAVGTVSFYDGRFLFRKVLEAGAGTVIEIGTASGSSTAYIAHALAFAHAAGAVGDDWRIVTYDAKSEFYADPSRGIGEAAVEMLPPELHERIEFRHPARSPDAAASHAPDSIEFLFIDADHRHPWPTLDMLVMLDSLRPGAQVLLHDINLPVRSPEFQDWGAKHLFDGIAADKEADAGDEIPNIGAVRIPADKERLRAQLRELAVAHPWEVEVDRRVSEPLLG